MKPVIRDVWEDDIPKYAATDKDHNCGVGVSACRAGSVEPGQIFPGNESKGLLSGVVKGLRDLWVTADGGVLVGEDDVLEVGNSLGMYGLLGFGWRVASWFSYDEGPKQVSSCPLKVSQDPRRRSVSGGVLSSSVLSRRGGMAAGEFRMKAPNDGTSIQGGSGMNWSLWARRLVMLGRISITLYGGFTSLIFYTTLLLIDLQHPLCYEKESSFVREKGPYCSGYVHSAQEKETSVH
nr:hypothetical protein [Tanacetum cinerariifolium]